MPLPNVSTGEAPVVLRGGPVVRVEVLRFLWSLEDRGFTFEVEADEVLAVRPAGRLTNDERALIRQWLPEIKLLVRYCDTAKYEGL